MVKKMLINVLLVSFAALQYIVIAQESPAVPGASYEQIMSEFITPADKNHLWCYWYWINDDISKAGITRDL
ncbi:MAG: hypothetical protein LLF76_05625, partial [Planctomycetaceae bacterium]|nr:hypothetical protein [Planctomycetaceae bacterium]